MQRTITLRVNEAFYKNISLGKFDDRIWIHFFLLHDIYKMMRSKPYKYRITIKKHPNGQYCFEDSDIRTRYRIHDRTDHRFLIGVVCKEELHELFPIVNTKDRFNITVKELPCT